MLALRSPKTGGEKETTLRHEEEHDLWVLRAVGKTSAGEQTLEMVVVGEAKH